MFASTPLAQAPRMAPEEFAPLLFSLQPIDQATPRGPTPGRTVDSSMSTQRRSVTPTGSIVAEGTPLPPPPPITRLIEDVVMDEPSTSRALRIATPTGLTPLGGASTISPYEAPAAQYEDVWVTVFGFTSADVNLVLQEFSKCGDVLQWGTFGQPQANFLHLQYQNKYGAQRALLRSGELLTPTLLVGVKPLDPRHRAAIEAYAAGADNPVQVLRPRPQPDRPYRVDVSGGQQMPRANRSFTSKVMEYVLGM